MTPRGTVRERGTYADGALVCLVVLIPRILLGALTGRWGSPQLWEYDAIAANLLAGRGFSYTFHEVEYLAFTTPIWPALLAVVLALAGGNYLAVQIFQVSLSAALALLAYGLARRLWGRGVGLLSGFLVALQPGIAYYSVVNSDPLPLNALLLLGLGAALLWLRKQPSFGRAVVTGILLGLSLMSRGTTTLVFLIALVMLVRRRRGPGLLLACTLAAAAALVTLPWMARNQLRLGQPVLTSTGGEMLWWGNNPRSSGGIYADTGESFRVLVPSRVRDVLTTSPRELDHDRAFRDEVSRFVRADPTGVARLWIRKFAQFWWLGASTGTTYPSWFLALYQPLYAAGVALSLLGFVVAFRQDHQRGPALILMSLPLSVAAFQSVFYVEGRHRWMVEAIPLIFAARALEWLLQRVRVQRAASRSPR